MKWDDDTVKRAQAAAAASRAQQGCVAGEAEGDPVVVSGKKATASSVRKWRNGLANGVLNAGQRSVVEKVADRVLMQEFSSSARGKQIGVAGSQKEPLLWVLHGGPGTGKSYVVQKIRK